MKRWFLVALALQLGGAVQALPPMGKALKDALPITNGPPRVGTNTPPTPPKQEYLEPFKLEHAEIAERDGNDLYLRGTVRFRYRGFIVECDEAAGNLDTENFRLKGSVKLRSESLNYTGNAVEVNFKEKSMNFDAANTVLGPDFVKGAISDNLYLRAGAGHGTEKRYLLTDAAATTCSLTKPHFLIDAKSMDVRPGEAVIMRHARLSILGHHILDLPYLTIPLNQDTPRYLPEIGQSQDEGVYIKTHFGLDTQGQNLLDGRFDMMTKKGFGLGLEQSYKGLSYLGKASIYALLGPNPSKILHLNDEHTMGNWKLTSGFDYSNQNYLTAPQTTTVGIRTNLVSNAFRLGFQRNSSDRVGFHTESQSVTLNAATKPLGFNTTVDLNLSSTNTKVGSGVNLFQQSRRVLDTRLRTTRDFGLFTGDLLYSRSIPIGTVTGFSSPSDQTPLLTLTSDTKRLMKWGMTMPITLGYGQLIDGISHKTLSRFLFETAVPGAQLGNKALSLRTSGRFRQSMYSDDTAQFVGSYDSTLKWTTGKTNSVNLRYGYLRAQGYSPLSIDRSGRSDSATLDISQSINAITKFAIVTGYDFLERPGKRTPWQTVSVRAEWAPSRFLFVRGISNYDTFNKVWNTTRFDFGFTAGDAQFTGGLRYDGLRHTFGQVTLVGQGIHSGIVKLDFLLNFNGYTRKFESRQAFFTIDLHCTEAIIQITDNQSGFRNGTSFAFYLRLKAIPFGGPLGGGTSGQQLGSPTGGIGF